MTATKTNPTGITNYDISTFARLPGWQQLAQALNAVALAAGKAEIGGGQDALTKAVGHLARGVAFMDCCQDCERRLSPDGPYVDTSAAPYATDIEDGWLRGRYRCANGHEWTCGYSTAFGSWFA